MRPLSPQEIRVFRRTVWKFFRSHRRSFPWRNTRNPYRILVSEVMLQQTQAPRVARPYERFIKTFPSFAALEKAPLRRLLSEWQGLGYNRRALALKQTAKIVQRDYSGKLPDSEKVLVSLPGVGPATAAAIRAFAFDKPSLYLDTNVRTVLLETFFGRKHSVPDEALLPLLEAVLERKRPREWYFALLDYGAWLKKTRGNAATRSVRWRAQSPFEGSFRQLRGLVLREMLSIKRATPRSLAQRLNSKERLVLRALKALLKEGLLEKHGDGFSVAA